MDEWIVNVLVSLVTAAATAFGMFLIQERRLRTELRTEFMAEQTARMLLEDPDWKKRSLGAIQKRLGGFGDDELRKILIGAGAVRFESKKHGEMWGLLSRNREEL